MNIHSYDVVLAHFRIENGVARAASGQERLARVPSLELLQLMMIFQDISPIQSFEAEPTMTITTRKGTRFLVRTDLHKLLFYDTSQMQQPARVMEGVSILLEIEDQKYEARLRDLEKTKQEALQKQAQALDRIPLPWTSFALLVMGLIVLYGAIAWRLSAAPSSLAWEDLAPSQSLALRHKVVGTYTTGEAAEDFGITVLPSGSLRFLRLGKRPPEQLKAAYVLGRMDGKLHLKVEGMPPIKIETEYLRMGDLTFYRR